jgi:hypothetical protein
MKFIAVLTMANLFATNALASGLTMLRDAAMVFQRSGHIQ